MKLLKFCPLPLFVALLATTELSIHAQTAVTGATDAYHLKYWEGSPYNAAYNEWWYYNLYDVQDNIQAIIVYQVADPLNLTGQGVGDLTAVVYQGQQIIAESDLYPLSAFDASYSAADVTLGANTTTVAGPNTYLISGASQDGKLSWNLSYERDAPAWFGAKRVNPGTLSWELMDWLVYMPGANVSGTLTINGRQFNISCGGYHDHNWGQWAFQDDTYNWAQYAAPDLTFDLGDFPANSNGRAGLNLQGQQMVFTVSQYTLVNTKWGYDPVNKLPYPIQSVFSASDGNVSVTMTMDVQNTEPLVTGAPPAIVIYEQPTHFTGKVTFNNDTAAQVTIDGYGFKEYTAKTSAQ
jgi:hypothetical protein